MTIQHKKLANGQWNELSLLEQMANIGSEVFRAMKWREKGNEDYANKAFDRSLELFDLTFADPKNQKRLREIGRAREVWCDYFFGDNEYQSTKESWEKYFYGFNYASRLKI